MTAGARKELQDVDESDPTDDGALRDDRLTGHRPQSLVFSFFGGVTRGTDLGSIPTSVFLRLLAGLGVAESAGRATLARMTRNGLLERTQVGRTAHYALTPRGGELVDEATARVLAPEPFRHRDGEWTLLSYSLPESRRDVRRRLRVTLAWTGFGGLRDGLWIAPGTIDVATVFAKAGLPEVADHADWFAATPMPGVRVDELIRRAWPVDRIRQQHDAFLGAWSPAPHEEDPLTQITRLGADWIRLLRSDPGLPAHHLSADWPAARSAVVYHRCYEALLPAARRRLDLELGRTVLG